MALFHQCYAKNNYKLLELLLEPHYLSIAFVEMPRLTKKQKMINDIYGEAATKLLNVDSDDESEARRIQKNCEWDVFEVITRHKP